MYGILIILAALWLYLLTVLKRAGLHFWYFVVGSVGIFLFMMATLQPLLTEPLTRVVAAAAGMLGEITGLFGSYFQYGILFVQNKGESISLYIDYECSGIIELMAFSALLWFFPVYQLYEKVVVNIIGIFVIFAANVIRIFSICILIYFFGNEIYYFAHTIFGRFLFYGCSIMLYFYVFTRSQIVRQKVGNFKYESD